MIKKLTSHTVKLAAASALTLLISGCSVALTSTGSAEPMAPEQPKPVYKKQVIIATGYANISAQNSENAAQRRLMAIRASKLDAYRSLTEQVYGQQLNASTTVEDMIVVNDTMRAHVEGLVYGAKVVSISPIGDDSYETKLELEQDTLIEIRSLFLAAK